LPGHHAPRATKVPANQSPRVFRRHKPAQGIGCSAFEHSEHGRRHPELRACVPGAKPNGSDHEAAQRAVGAFFLGNLGEGADREELAPGALLRAIERGGPRADTSAPRQRWRSRGMSSVAARAALYALILCSGVVRWRCVDIKQGPCCYLREREKGGVWLSSMYIKRVREGGVWVFAVCGVVL